VTPWGRSHKPPDDELVCTTTYTNYQWDQSYHLQALDLFALFAIGLLAVMIWKKYKKEDV